MDDIMINNDDVNYLSSSRKRPLLPNSSDSKAVTPSTLGTVRRKLNSDDPLYDPLYSYNDSVVNNILFN